MADLIISNVKVAKISDEDLKSAIDAMKVFKNTLVKNIEAFKNLHYKGYFPNKKTNIFFIEDIVEECGRNAGDHICNGCDLAGTNCEGSKCGEQAAFYYERLSRKGKRRAYFDTYGKDDYYNLSLRVKVRLLNY